MKIVQRPSPNFNERDGQPVDMLVLHYTGMQTAEGALNKLCDPNSDKRVSAHYLVDEDGMIYQLVPEEKRAWHAGVSSWRGNSNINQRSIGIEIVNPGHDYGYRPFPKAQMDAVAALSKEIIARHGIPGWNVIGHSDIAPGRKNDPGELFDWKFLAEQGIGAMPRVQRSPLDTLTGWVARLFSVSPALEKGAQGAGVFVLQQKLAAIGYGIEPKGDFDVATQDVVKAFQQHFRPQKLNGKWDDECNQLLEGLLKQTPAAIIAVPGSRMAAL